MAAQRENPIGPRGGEGGMRFARKRATPSLGDVGRSDRTTPWYRTGLGALAIVLAIFGAAFWLVRRWAPSGRFADGGAMKVVARTALTPKQSLALVQLGRRYVLVGLSPDRVDSLGEVTDAEEVAELAARIGLGRLAPRESFDALLSGEASDYRELPGLPAHSSEPDRSQRTTPGALTELLRKLRTLQPVR